MYVFMCVCMYVACNTELWASVVLLS